MTWNLFSELFGADPWGEGPVWTSPFRGRLGERTGPYLNIHGNEEKLMVVSEIAGLDPESLEITVHGRSLTVSGARKLPELAEDECRTYNERVGGDFTRSIVLPYEVETDQVEATYERGVLVVKLPRAEKDKPRKIEVKAA